MNKTSRKQHGQHQSTWDAMMIKATPHQDSMGTAG